MNSLKKFQGELVSLRTAPACLRLFAGALLLATGVAGAAPITVQGAEAKVNTAGFSHLASFTLAERSAVSLDLLAWTQINRELRSLDLSVVGLQLQRGGDAPLILSLPDWTAQPDGRRNAGTGSGRGFATAEYLYELPELVLDAGSWSLSLIGADADDKRSSGLELRASADPRSNAVPLPGSLALAGLGLVLGALSLRRRQA